MPRSATKSQADKRKVKASIHETTPPTQDLKEEDVIRGQLTRAQWIDALNQEDADETVGEITEELMSKVMEGCLKVDIKRQVKLKGHIHFRIPFVERDQIQNHQNYPSISATLNIYKMNHVVCLSPQASTLLRILGLEQPHTDSRTAISVPRRRGRSRGIK